MDEDGLLCMEKIPRKMVTEEGLALLCLSYFLERRFEEKCLSSLASGGMQPDNQREKTNRRSRNEEDEQGGLTR